MIWNPGLFGMLGAGEAGDPERVTVQGTQFYLDGSQVYMNAANTPWDNWDDFGGSYDSEWWDSEFARMKAKGINSSRVWISCSGDVEPSIDSSGYVTGVTQAFWDDVDHYMGLASKYKIYVMPSMMSFDHTTDYTTNYLLWRTMFSSSDRVQAMIDNYIVPFVVRYKDNPYLYAIDLCNEPEWMNENAASGNIPVAQLQRYVAMSVAAIHESSSEVLVTVGSACVKWNSETYEANYWSNSALQAQYDDSDAYLDFYQIHYYLWMEPWYPLLRSPADHGLTDRPLVMGELPAKDDPSVFPEGVTMAQAFASFFTTGYSGHYPWTSNGVDSNGSLTDFGDDALAFQQAHSEVRPNYTQLDYEEFTSDLGGYTSAGTDCYWTTGTGESGGGAMTIRDNTTTSIGTLTDSFDLTIYDTLRIEFWANTAGFGTGHDYFLELWDGTDWQIIGTWVAGTDFDNGTPITPEVIVTDAEQTFDASALIRFRVDASNDGDLAYFDNLRISAL